MQENLISIPSPSASPLSQLSAAAGVRLRCDADEATGRRVADACWYLHRRRRMSSMASYADMSHMPACHGCVLLPSVGEVHPVLDGRA